MKNLKTILCGILLLSLAPMPAFAAKGARKGAGKNREVRPHRLLKEYDADQNGKIDGAEADKLRQAFATNTALKPLDLNANGQLDDSEVAAIKPREGKAAKGGKKAGKKKAKNNA